MIYKNIKVEDLRQEYVAILFRQQKLALGKAKIIFDYLIFIIMTIILYLTFVAIFLCLEKGDQNIKIFDTPSQTILSDDRYLFVDIAIASLYNFTEM